MRSMFSSDVSSSLRRRWAAASGSLTGRFAFLAGRTSGGTRPVSTSVRSGCGSSRTRHGLPIRPHFRTKVQPAGRSACARTRRRNWPCCASGRGGGSGSCPRPPFAGSRCHLRRRRWQRCPAGDGPDARPRILIVGDPGEPTAQLDRRRQFTVSLIDGADCGGIGFGDDEHTWKDGRRHCVGQGERRQAKGPRRLRQFATRAERPPLCYA